MSDPRPAVGGDAEGFHLGAYLDRIGHTGPVAADLPTLRAVHRAQVMSIPFENLDPVHGIVPSLDLADLHEKIVAGGRGGYCYEQNLLLTAALRAIGLTVRLIMGRVAIGTGDPATRPRTHLALRVEVPGLPVPYLADCGFGSAGALIEPVPFTPDAEQLTDGRRHRLLRDPGVDGPDTWTLQAWGSDGWTSQYVLTTEPVERPDCGVANWFVATYPRSPFRKRLHVTRTGPGVHRSLMGTELTVTDADGTAWTREVGEEDIAKVLVEEMGIDVPRRWR
ncbi:arylamine N-acetyltransferase [Streptomyces sp. NPDC004610]|uniref:arylamine N-acetyltransferase family protein n=1 Tax=unclassified Streptomyces TaxID=2593676 RepID=UPI0033B5E463